MRHTRLGCSSGARWIAARCASSHRVGPPAAIISQHCKLLMTRRLTHLGPSKNLDRLCILLSVVSSKVVLERVEVDEVLGRQGAVLQQVLADTCVELNAKRVRSKFVRSRRSVQYLSEGGSALEATSDTLRDDLALLLDRLAQLGGRELLGEDVPQLALSVDEVQLVVHLCEKRSAGGTTRGSSRGRHPRWRSARRRRRGFLASFARLA